MEGSPVHVPEPSLPIPPLAGDAPPLQPGHTQVTVVTAPESLGERVVLNFQLCDLSGEDRRWGCWGRGLGPLPSPGTFRTHSRVWGRWHPSPGPARSLPGSSWPHQAHLSLAPIHRTGCRPSASASRSHHAPGSVPRRSLLLPVTAPRPRHPVQCNCHQIPRDWTRCKPDSVPLCLKPSTAVVPLQCPCPPHQSNVHDVTSTPKRQRQRAGEWHAGLGDSLVGLGG